MNKISELRQDEMYKNYVVRDLLDEIQDGLPVINGVVQF